MAAVIFDGFSPFEFGIACEVFGVDRSDLGVDWYRFMVCAVGSRRIKAHTGIEVESPLGVDELERADTVVVPARYTGESPLPELLQALRDANARGARILSICTGAFLLAQAGLLDGRTVTTHWMYADELARTYPGVKVDPGVLYIDDGDILTSAGTASGIDLCLHVVRRDFGAEIANAVARRMVVPPHREGGQAQYIDEPMSVRGGDDAFAEALTWAQSKLREPLSLEQLAARSLMSPRTFSRRFRSTVGTTPHQWLVAQRVLCAQRLLETSELSIDRIAAESGFGTSTNLRHHFQHVVRTSPQAYRRTFRRQSGDEIGTLRAPLDGV